MVKKMDKKLEKRMEKKIEKKMDNFAGKMDKFNKPDEERSCPCNDSSCTTCGGRCWHLCHFMSSTKSKPSVCLGCGKLV